MAIESIIKNKNILLTLGPDYLCKTTTIYFLDYLLENNCKVLIVLDPTFNKLDSNNNYEIKEYINNLYPNNFHYVCIKRKNNFISNEINRYKEIELIYENNQIDVVLLHAYTYKEPVPYVAYANKFKKITGLYQQGLIAKDIVQHHKIYRNYNKTFKNVIKSYLVNSFLPFLFTGNQYYPRWNTYYNEMDINGFSPDFSIVFSKQEKNFVEKQSLSKSSYCLDFPMIRNHEKINKILYGQTIESNSLLILPTVGVFEYILKDLKVSKDDIVKKYVQTINDIAQIEGVKNVLIKFHPSENQLEIWTEILKLVSLNYEIIENANAEKLILENRVILSEFSTVLWWSSFYETKKVYSLDLFKLPLFDHYKGFENITYIGVDALL